MREYILHLRITRPIGPASATRVEDTAGRSLRWRFGRFAVPEPLFYLLAQRDIHAIVHMNL